jgi:6-phosphogluconolactonase
MIQKYILYVGTYSVRGSQGIYGCIFEPRTGSLQPLGWMADAINPSFLALNESQHILYSVREVDNYLGEHMGAIGAYRIDKRSGALEPLNEVTTLGAGPCYLYIDTRKDLVFTANYAGGSIAAIPLQNDGSLGEPIIVAQHLGSGCRPDRQNKAHPHAVALTRDGSLLLVADLGMDQILVYRLCSSKGQVSLAHVGKVHDGAGPRHFVMNHAGNRLYVANEIDSTVTTFSFEQESGILRAMQTLSTLPPGYLGPSDAAEIWLSDDDRFLYVSNRGADTLASFEVHRGLLTPSASYAASGSNPITFASTPGEGHMVVANQGSDQVTLLRRDRIVGVLEPTGWSVRVPAPSSLVFFPLEQ